MKTSILNKIGLDTEEIFDYIVRQHLSWLFLVYLIGKGSGEIEFKTLNPRSIKYFKSIEKAHNMAKELVLKDSRKDLYYGVNPRSSKTGTIADIEYLSTIHAVLPYDSPNNKRTTKHKTPEEAIYVANHFKLQPTYWIRTPEEIQCFWIAKVPVLVNNFGWGVFRDINELLANELGGNKDVCSIDAYLRMFYFRDIHEEGYSDVLYGKNYVEYSFLELLRLIE